MGLTIYYSLATSLRDAEQVARLVETMRQFALDLPFEEVSEVVQLSGEEASEDEAGNEDQRWLKIQGTAFVSGCEVNPLHLIGFSTWPGKGCESANFGFCTYPDLVERQSEDGRKRKVRTGLEGWRWASFCKTQYASDPRFGGMEHFLRCHLSVIKMLDFIRRTELVTVDARDEGSYWESRDLERLVKEVVEWNEQVAAIVGLLRPLLEEQGGKAEAPITSFPHFEHLEAKGAEKLAALWKSLGDRQ